MNDVEKILREYILREDEMAILSEIYPEMISDITKELNALIEKEKREAYDKGYTVSTLMQKEEEPTTTIADTAMQDPTEVERENRIRREANLHGYTKGMRKGIGLTQRDTLIKYQNYKTLQWNDGKIKDYNQAGCDKLDIESVEQYLKEIDK